jgi:hypothetical protein
MSRERDIDATEATRGARSHHTPLEIGSDRGPLSKVHREVVDKRERTRVHRRCTATPAREFQMYIQQLSSALSLFLLISCGPSCDPESSTDKPTARLGAGALYGLHFAPRDR